MHHPTDRITHTTAFVTPVVEHWLEREIAQWVVACESGFTYPLQRRQRHARRLVLVEVDLVVPVQTIQLEDVDGGNCADQVEQEARTEPNTKHKCC